MPSLRSAPGTLAPSMSDGSSSAVTTVELQSEREHAGARRAGEQAVAREDLVESLLLDEVEGDVERHEQGDGRRERAVRRILALTLGGLAPVEVVAAAGLRGGGVKRALGHRREAEPGRAHERLLGPGHDDVDAPLV